MDGFPFPCPDRIGFRQCGGCGVVEQTLRDLTDARVHMGHRAVGDLHQASELALHARAKGTDGGNEEG